MSSASIPAAVLLFAAILFAQPPEQDNPTPVQPLPFSHKTHAANALKCPDCHANSDPGVKMLFPATAKCMTCHATLASDKPSIQKLADFAKSGQPIPWVRVYTVPVWISWSHRIHFKAGLACNPCHGDVSQMDVVAKVTNVTKMAGCTACHRVKSATLDCHACHDLGPGN